ncbi:TPA: hypothetical protein MW242_001885 [Acinetobacter baumannii]|nr:hypothetical protein [Acinetobacter baumannii]
MKEISWPDLSGFGAQLVVSPANQYRAKTAMLLINDTEKFNHEILSTNPSTLSVDEVMKSAYFLKVENESDQLAYYYKNPNKKGIDLNDIKKILPEFSAQNKRMTPESEIYLTTLPFEKHIQSWKNYFSTVRSRFQNFGEVYLSTKIDNVGIIQALNESVLKSNKSWVSNVLSSAIPFNRLEEYGYSNIFSKLYLDEETAISNGEDINDLVKSHVSPFSLPVNYESTGAILFVNDIRQIPEIFAFDPLNDLDLSKNVNLLKYAALNELTFKQLLKHLESPDLFYKNNQQLDKYIHNLADDIKTIKNLYHEQNTTYPVVNEKFINISEIDLFKDNLGIWMVKNESEKSRLTDEHFYNALLFRHDIISQIIAELPNKKVYNKTLNDSYLSITSSALMKFNSFYDYQTSIIKQNELDEQLSNENVSIILDELNVDFNTQDKELLTPSDLVNMVNDIKSSSSNIFDEIKSKISIPNNFIDDKGNINVKSYAPAMLEVRQVLDVYVVPLAKTNIAEIENTYSKVLNEEYDKLNDFINKNVDGFDSIAQELKKVETKIEAFKEKYNNEYNLNKKILWESETIIDGITAATDQFVYNRSSFYYKKANDNQFLPFINEIEMKDHKAELHKLISNYFENRLPSLDSEKFKLLIDNHEAIERLITRAKGYESSNLDDNLKPIKEKTENEETKLSLQDIFATPIDSSTLIKNKFKFEFDSFLDEINYEVDFLLPALKSISLKEFYDKGVFQTLSDNLLKAPEQKEDVRDFDNILDTIISNISSSNAGFDLTKLINRKAEVEAFAASLSYKYPSKNFDFLSDSGDVVRNHYNTIHDKYTQSFENTNDLSKVIENVFVNHNSFQKALNLNLSAQELFVQNTNFDSELYLSVDKMHSDYGTNNNFINLGPNFKKAFQQAYQNIGDKLIEKLLYLDADLVNGAKDLASYLISKNDSKIKHVTKEILGIPLELNDFTDINSIDFNDHSLSLNDKIIDSFNLNRLQTFNFLNLVDIYKRSMFGQFDVEIRDEFRFVPSLLKANTNFTSNLEYLKIAEVELNYPNSDENGYFNYQLENAINLFEVSFGPISSLKHDIYIAKFQADGINYLRLIDNNNSSLPYIHHSRSVDLNLYKRLNVSDIDSLRISANALFKLNARNFLNFMPPARLTFEQHYDSNLNHFIKNDSNLEPSSLLFKSLPVSIVNHYLDKSISFNLHNDILKSKNGDLIDYFEDLVFDQKLDDVNKFLDSIAPSYSFVITSIDNNSVFLPRNLVDHFDCEAFVEVDPVHLLNPKLSINDIKDIFMNGLPSNDLINKHKFNTTTHKLHDAQGLPVVPPFFKEQLELNNTFVEKYSNLTDLDNVDSLIFDHIGQLHDLVNTEYNSTLNLSISGSSYTLYNRSSPDDIAPSFYIVNREYNSEYDSILIRSNSSDVKYKQLAFYRDLNSSKSDILNNVLSKVKFGLHLEELAFNSLNNISIVHKSDYENKHLLSLNFTSLITNALAGVYEEGKRIKNFLSPESRNLLLSFKPSSDHGYGTFKLAPSNESVNADYKTLCIFPLNSFTSVEDVLFLKNNLFTDFNFIHQLLPKVNYLDNSSNVVSVFDPAKSYLGDVGKKFGGAHKDRFGHHITLDYISSTSVDQTTSDYRKAKIIPNKEFQQWYSTTSLPVDDKIFVKAMYDYCPPKPLFSNNALKIDTHRAAELGAYVAVVSNIRNLMVDTHEKLLLAINDSRSLSSDALAMTDRQRKSYINLYQKGTKNNYKNYFEILSDLNQYYITSPTSGISEQLDKILEKTIDKEFGEKLYTGKIFDFYSKLKVENEISEAISHMQRTGLFSAVLEPFVLKSAIDSGLLKPESAPVYVQDVETKADLPDMAIKSKQTRVPSYIVDTKHLPDGSLSEKYNSHAYGLLNYERIGPDYRQGVSIDSFKLKSDFNLSGVEIGTTVSNVAQPLLHAVYDALSDLKQIMGFHSNHGFLDIGIALASRGIKSSAAHYDLNKNVVNLTRDSGAGSLVHEYAHALDAYIGTLEKAEVYKNQSSYGQRIINDLIDEIPGFDIPSTRHNITQMLEFGYNPITEIGQAFEKIYNAISYKPVSSNELYSEQINKQKKLSNDSFSEIVYACEDEILAHKEAYSATDRNTLRNFFSWYEAHYSSLIDRQFSKIEEYLVKYRDEYKNDNNLSFFRSVQSKVDNVISRINTDINSLTFRSYEKHQDKLNSYKNPADHLPISGSEDKINRFLLAAGHSLETTSQKLNDFLIADSQVKFYNLIEKYMPYGIENPHTQLESFFDKNRSSDLKHSFTDTVSAYKEACLNYDRELNKSKPYYATGPEMFARYFETYVYSKLQREQALSNTFLIDNLPVVSPKGLELEICNNLTKDFAEKCAKTFDTSLAAIQKIEHENEKAQAYDQPNLTL